ncbi:hypothetical protein GQ53DRAFT_745125 [Thozetella sp. PMI_491]|nr:hypothetical protein GQ53DRAFT_745125 [Thozetella sp. PMI_491]
MVSWHLSCASADWQLEVVRVLGLGAVDSRTSSTERDAFRRYAFLSAGKQEASLFGTYSN